MLWKIIGWVLVLAVIVTVAVAGIGYYYSTVLTTPSDPNQSRDQQVVAADDTTVTLALDRYTQHPGRNSLLWDDGHAFLGEQRDKQGSVGDGTVTYDVDVTRGDLTVPLDVLWSAWYFDTGDPSSRGLDFEEVTPRSDVGDLPSWYLPGTSDTWTIVVHGINGDRDEALRILPTLVDSGSPTLVIRYRNDPGVPTTDNLLRLGDTEWIDVQAAMDWARDRGAQRFVLYGFSYGGAVALQALDRAEGSDDIAALVLDSPVVDWQAVLDQQAVLRGLPTVLAWAAGIVTELRLDLDLDDFDWVARADDLDVPILVLHGPDDTFVPYEPNQALAQLRSDIVTLESFDGAEHVRSWNVDAQRYEQVVGEFLAGVL